MITRNSGQESCPEGGPYTPARIADTARRRAIRRTTCLGIAALLLWTSAAIGAIVMVHGMFRFILPGLVLGLGPKATDRDWTRAVTALRVAHDFGIPLTYVWGGFLVLAAIVTMLYVRSHHNVGLAQIRTELQDISHELRRLADKGRTQVD